MNDHLHISEAGLQLITGFEGLYLTAYYCPAGVLSIGYGHTSASGDKPRVYPGMQITEDEARSILACDLFYVYEPIVKRLVKVPLNQHQFDALVSFVFNVGETAFAASTLLRKLNKGDYAAVPAELMKWVKATVKGQRVQLNGLVRRRRAEAALWRSMVADIAPPAPEEHEVMAQKVEAPPPAVTKDDKLLQYAAAATPVLSAFSAITDWRLGAVACVMATAIVITYILTFRNKL
jgi:lysozyme